VSRDYETHSLFMSIAAWYGLGALLLVAARAPWQTWLSCLVAIIVVSAFAGAMQR
jgi:hypothetical protein